jgi:hypothetical protein
MPKLHVCGATFFLLGLLIVSAAAGGGRKAHPTEPVTGKLVLVPEAKAPVTIVLVSSKRARVGMLTLLVKNESSAKGRLRLRFFVEKTGVYSDLVGSRLDRPPRDRPAFYNEKDNMAIASQQTRLLQLRFAVSPDAEATVLNGLLVLTLKPEKRAKVARVTVQTLGQFATGAPTGTEPAQPTSPSMVVTSLLPFGHWVLWGEHQEVRIPAKTDESIDRKQVAILGSDSAGLLRATLTARNSDEGKSDGLTPARIVVDQVGRSDKYSGNLFVGPAASEKLALTVHVRDWFFWPLFVLGIGAFLGGFGTRRWEERRRRALLDKRAKEAYEVYAPHAKRPDGSPPPPLDPDPKDRLQSLLAAIGQAKTDEEYNARVDEVASYEADLRDWLRMARAADGLQWQEPPSEAKSLAEDVEDMIAWLAVPPDEPAGRDELADQAERLVEILHAFIPVWQLWNDRQRPDLLNPAGLYRRKAFASDQATLRVRRSLEERRRDILHWQPPEGAITPEEHAFLLRAMPSRLAQGLDRGGLGQMLWRPVEQLSPKAIEHRVRMFDWAVALITGAVTLVAFLLTKYGQEFGSFSDYAQAFTAGFLGQLAGAAIAWNLFPPFRSYRATKTAAAAEPTKA